MGRNECEIGHHGWLLYQRENDAYLKIVFLLFLNPSAYCSVFSPVSHNFSDCSIIGFLWADTLANKWLNLASSEDKERFLLISVGN